MALWELIILVVVIGATTMFVGGGLIGFVFTKKKEAEDRAMRMLVEALNKIPETMVKTYQDVQKAEEETKRKKEYEEYMKNREDIGTKTFNRV